MDHSLTALRTTAAGVVMAIDKHELSAEIVRSAAQRAHDGAHRAATKRVATEIAALPSTDASVARLEKHAALPPR